MRTVFHTLRPHNALTPVPVSPEQIVQQRDNEGAWCHMIVNHVLALLLPPEDLQNPCLHVLVSDILSEMIFRNGICGKTSESWFIWDGITKGIYAVRPDLVSTPQPEPSQTDRLEQFGLLSTSQTTSEGPDHKSRHTVLESLAGGFWHMLQVLSLIWLLSRSFIAALLQAATLPARAQQDSKDRASSPSQNPQLMEDDAPEGFSSLATSSGPSSQGSKQPLIAMRVWMCAAKLTHLHDRMPWLTGFLSLVQWLLLAGPGQLCRTDSTLDR